MARILRCPEPQARESLLPVLIYMYDRSMTGEALVVVAKKMMMTALLMTRDLNVLIGRLAFPMLGYVNLMTCCITVFLLFL
jgi:hypothetical protein